MKTQHNHLATGPESQPSAVTPSPTGAPQQVIPRTELQPDLKSSLGAPTGENLRQADRARIRVSRAARKPAGAPGGSGKARPSGPANSAVGPSFGQDAQVGR